MDGGRYLEQDPLSRKSSASSTTSLDRQPFISRHRISDKQITGVKAKIAMFSHGKSGLGKFESAEDIGNISAFSSAALTRAHTHGDVRYEDNSKKHTFQSSLKQLKKVNPDCIEDSATNLVTRKKNASFRSMINVSSNKYLTKDEKAVSVKDLSKSTRVMIKEEAPKPIISNRSQSLGEIVGKNKPDMYSQGRSRSSNMLGQNPSRDINKKSSFTMLEQRRRSAMNKLKGLVIPEGKETVSAESNESEIVNLLKSDKIVFSKKNSTSPQPDKKESTGLSKFSPSSKRKSFAMSSPNTPETNLIHDSSKIFRSKREEERAKLLANKPPIAKRDSDEGFKPYSISRQEDSDNDSAVSSSRSSLSGRSNASLPSSPKSSSKGRDFKVLKKSSKDSSKTSSNIDFTTAECKEKMLEKLKTSSRQRNPDRIVSRSSSINLSDRKFTREPEKQVGSRRGSNSSQDSYSKRNSKDSKETINDIKFVNEYTGGNSQKGSLANTQPLHQKYPDTILDLEDKVSYINDIVDQASSITPTDRRSLSRTNSIASTISNRSSRNSSIVSEKVPFGRTSSMLSKDSAISEDLADRAVSNISSSRKNSDKWPDLEKKYSKGSNSIEEKISRLIGLNEDSGGVKKERPKDLIFSEKKPGLASPNSKNFKVLTEKWQSFSSESLGIGADSPDTSMLPRKKSEELIPNPSPKTKYPPSTLQRLSRDSQIEETALRHVEEFPWSTEACKNSFYQVSGDTEWSGFDMAGKSDIPDRKFSVPVFNDCTVKLREKKDNVPSRPSSLIESSEQKDLKVFEIGNLGDSNRLILNSNSTSRSSSQADLLDCTSVTSDPKSPLPSSSSREILDAFSNRNSRRAVSVNDIRRAFEKAEQSLSNSGTPRKSGLPTSSSHNRMSSLDSTTSEESSIPTPHFHGSVSSLASGHSGLKDHYGSITSLASSTSVISPQVFNYLII